MRRFWQIHDVNLLKNSIIHTSSKDAIEVQIRLHTRPSAVIRRLINMQFWFNACCTDLRFFAWPTTGRAKVSFSRKKSKFVLFSHEILLCKSFQMTYYLFISDVPNRSCVILKYSSLGNYIWRKMQSKFGKYMYASLATHTYSMLKLLECRLIIFC